MAVSAAQGTLSGLPRRLVQDGIVTEDDLTTALTEAKQSGSGLVPVLVERKFGDPREIAVAAAHEFGVPLLDLDAVELDLDIVRLVSEKLLSKHRVLPLLQRGKRLYIAVGDPTNLHALDEIKFQTNLRVEPVVAEQDKLEDRVARVGVPRDNSGHHHAETFHAAAAQAGWPHLRGQWEDRRDQGLDGGERCRFGDLR
jgi:type IV pilus assembly protein PilB